MGRIRTVKPEMYLHEGLFDLEIETGLPIRFAWTGMFTVCDREGRFRWRPRAIKAQILPYDELEFSRVLDALVTRGFIVKYACQGEQYGWIPTFKRHQVINNRESDSVLPAPNEDDGTFEHQGANIPPEVRAFVFDRDGHVCGLCNSTQDLTLDHVKPRCTGGGHEPENLRVLCRSCNSARPVGGHDTRVLSPPTTRADASTESLGSAQGEGERKGKGRDNTSPASGDADDTDDRKPKSPYTEAFEQFWLVYPRKKDKRAAFAPWKRALSRVATERGIPSTEAAAYLLEAVQAFAPSELGQAGQFCPYGATWLNAGSYDDDRAEWDRDRNGKPQDNRQLSGAETNAITDLLLARDGYNPRGGYDPTPAEARELLTGAGYYTAEDKQAWAAGLKEQFKTQAVTPE